jgi:hypothetical protein
MLSRAFSLVSSESAVPAPPLLRRTTRPYTQHNTGAASAANETNAANASKETIANIFNGQPRRNLRSSLKRAQTAAVNAQTAAVNAQTAAVNALRKARRVTFPGFNNLSPPATPVNSQASTPKINFFPNLPNENKGGRRKQSRRKRTQKRKQSRRRA